MSVYVSVHMDAADLAPEVLYVADVLAVTFTSPQTPGPRVNVRGTPREVMALGDALCRIAAVQMAKRIKGSSDGSFVVDPPTAEEIADLMAHHPPTWAEYYSEAD